MDNPNLTQEQRNALGQWAATLVGAMAGGTQGAATALDAEKFNRQLHVKEGDLIKANAARYAVQQGYCQSADNCSADAIARAQGELTMEALRRVDSAFADINASQTAGAFLDELAQENSAPAGQSLFSATPEQFTNHVLNVEYLSQNKDLYDTFGKPGESKYYTAYVAALVSAANDAADLKNATPAQASAVLNGLKDAIGVVEQGQGNATGLENALTGSEQTYLQLLQSLTNAISTTAGTNGSALRQFAIQNAALVDGLMANAAFAQSAGKLIQVEYMIAVGGGAALPVAQELAAMCSLGAQACAAQANVIFQEIVASIPELGGTGVGLAGIAALDKEVVDQALTKAAATGPLTSGGGANAATGALLREDLARQAGIPRSIETVWGSSLDDLKASYEMDGWTITDKAPRASSSGNSQIFTIDAPQGGGPVVNQVQYSPASTASEHAGQYYKFSYSDGATVKVIDPATYRVTGWPETNTTFYNQAGNKIFYDAASKTWSAH